MPWIQLEQYRFHYQLQGAMHQPKLLFLHGFMGSGDDFDAVMTALASVFCCLSVDLPGHGQTETLCPSDGYQIESVAQELLVLLSALNFTPCYLVGYSMGGRLALYLACFWPQQFTGVMLESASPGLATAAERTQRRQQDEQLAQTLESGDWSYFIQQWYEQPIFIGLKQSAAFGTVVQKRQHNRPRELAQVLRDMGIGIQPSLWDALPTLQIPIALMVGALDAKFLHINQLMVNRCPSAQLTIVPHCGHVVHHEAPHAFIEVLRTGLRHKKEF